MLKETVENIRTVIDEIYDIWDPVTHKKRLTSRLQGEYIKREYEAASRGRRMAGWRAGRKHPSLEADKNATIEDRVRDLIRNDGYAKRGRKILQGYTVGTGITGSIRNGKGEKDEEMTAIFNKWAKKVGCDARKRNSFYGLQSLVMREIVTAGESIILKKNIPLDRVTKNIPLNLLVIESAYLDLKKDDGVNTISGVEFSDQAPSRYWIRSTTVPGVKSEQESSPVAASDVIHVFEEERPGQVRGVSWFAPVVTPLRDLDEYRDAEITRRKVAACFAAFVTDNNMDVTPEAKESFSKLEPGAIEFLAPGQDVKFSSPPSTAEYAPYCQTEIQKIAAGLGVTYEHLSQNLRDVNFSSARIGQIPFLKFVKEWQTQLLVPQFLDRVFEWFKEAAILVHGSAWVDATIEWTLPRVEMLDEQKETDAINAKIRSGLTSQSEAIRSLGGDPDRVFKEIDTDNTTLDGYKIILDTDPRKVTKAGIVQTSYQSTGGNTIDE